MSLYSKIELYSFADFYHRFAVTGLTLEEMFLNWEKYRDEPRDANDVIKLPKRLKQEIEKIKPPADILHDVVNAAAKMNHIHRDVIVGAGNSRKRRHVTARQQTAYVGSELGFDPLDFEEILKWNRSGVYHRINKAGIYANRETRYRKDLSEILKLFGQEPFKV